MGTSKNAKNSTSCANCENEKNVISNKNCGEIELNVIIEHVTKRNRRQYKSINHIKNMLKCLQAEEWRDVPGEISNIVENDL